MVASDTDARMFNERYIEKEREEGRNLDGLTIGGMIKDDGKVYVLYNTSDSALTFSKLTKGGFFAQRLGAEGIKESRLHPDLKGKVEDYNYKKKHMPFWY